VGVLVWAHLGLVGLAIPIALIDLRDHRLPDRLTLPLWGGSALVALAAERDVALHGMLSSALVVLFLLLAAEWPGRPLGYGDVKLGGDWRSNWAGMGSNGRGGASPLVCFLGESGRSVRL
jgi:Flp pilus assembly protein protease CpaA